MSKRRSKIIPPLSLEETTPQAVIFSTPTDFEYTKIDVGTYKGLLYMEVLGATAGNNGRILTVWRSRSAYEAAKPRFLSGANLEEARVLFEGFHLDTCLANKSWWRRLTLSQIWAGIATIFLALGYVGQIRDASGWLFGPPKIERSVPPVPIDVLLGERFKCEVAARNIRSLGDCYIWRLLYQVR